MNREDKFAHKAKEYEALQRRLDTANAIALKIKENIALTKEIHYRLWLWYRLVAGSAF